MRIVTAAAAPARAAQPLLLLPPGVWTGATHFPLPPPLGWRLLANRRYEDGEPTLRGSTRDNIAPEPKTVGITAP